MYACMYAYIPACVYVCMYVCMPACVYVCMRACVRACVCMPVEYHRHKTHPIDGRKDEYGHLYTPTNKEISLFQRRGQNVFLNHTETWK